MEATEAEWKLKPSPEPHVTESQPSMAPSLDIEHDAQAADAASPSENLRPGTWPWSLVSDALKKLKEEKEMCIF